VGLKGGNELWVSQAVLVSWRALIRLLCSPHLVSGCVNSHCPVFHFELGARVKSSLICACLGVRLSETADPGPIKGTGRASSLGSQASRPQLPWGQDSLNLSCFEFRLSSFQVSLQRSEFTRSPPHLLGSWLGCAVHAEAENRGPG
jgi:hypothetical protein